MIVNFTSESAKAASHAVWAGILRNRIEQTEMIPAKFACHVLFQQCANDCKLTLAVLRL